MEENNATEAVAETTEVETAVSDVSETAEVEAAAPESVEAESVESVEAEEVEAVETEAKEETAEETEAVETEAEEEAEETKEAEAAEEAAVKPTSIDDLASKMKLDGTVSRLELYGAFIDIGVGTNALIHISKLGKEHVNRVSDVLQVGDVVSVWVDKVNPDQGQIMVTMVEPLAVDWSDLKKGQTYTGTINRLENYGAFINIGAEREGLVHISEISHEYVKHPSELLTVGDEVQVEVLDFSRRKRRIDLSIKNLQEKPEDPKAIIQEYKIQEADEPEEELEDIPTAMEVALRKAMGDEPVDAAMQGPRKRGRRRNRRKKRRRDQDDLLNRTLHYQDN